MKNVQKQATVQSKFLLVSIAAGASTGLILVALFLSGADNAKPEWGTYWVVKPLVMMPLAGMAGEAVFGLLLQKYTHGAERLLAVLFGSLIFLTGLWLGMVLGFNGTYWN